MWYGCVVCCGVRKYPQKKFRERLEISQNTDSFFGTIWSTMGQKKVRKRSFFPAHCFLHFPWDLPTFSAEGPIPNAQKGTFLPEVLIQRSCVGKGPNQRNTGKFQWSNCTLYSTDLSRQFLRMRRQPLPSVRIYPKSNKPCLFLGRSIHRIPRVFNDPLDPNSNARVTMAVFDITCPAGISHR